MMQLTISSESIVGINMSALEESRDNQEVSALINNIKKDIQSNVKDDLKVKDEDVSESILAKGEADIDDIKLEIQINGRGEDEIIPNGSSETLNIDKENDVPKDSEIVVKIENNVENTANSTTIVNIANNKVKTNNMDTGNDNASSTQDETAKEDTINSVIENMPTVNESESDDPGKKSLDVAEIASERPNSDNAKTFNEKPLRNNEQVDAQLTSHLTNNMEKSTAENTEQNPLSSDCINAKEIKSEDSKSEEKVLHCSQMDVDVNEAVENSTKDVEVDKSAIVECNEQLEIPAEIIGNQNATSDRDLKDSNNTDNVSIDEQNNILMNSKDQEKGDIGGLKMTETLNDVDKKNNENTSPREEIADPVVKSSVFEASEDKISSLDDNDKQITSRDIKTETEDDTVIKKENRTEIKNNENISSDKVIESTTNDATAPIIETKCDKLTENKKTVDVSQNVLKSEPIDESNSNFSDEISNEISIKTEMQHSNDDPNESKAVVENPVVEKLKDTECISVSSMEVDDVEIVPTEKNKTEISKSQDVAMDVSVTNDEDNVIEIFDQDVVESTDKIESGKKTEMNFDSKEPSNKTEDKSEDKVDISDEDDIKIVENTETKPQTPKKDESSVESKSLPVVCKLSNTLDILSDEEDEPPSKVSKVSEKKPEDKQCIDIDDDDDIMLIEDTKETTTEAAKVEKEEAQKTSDKVDDKIVEKEAVKPIEDPTPKINEKEPITTDIESPKVSEKEASPPKETSKPLLPINFLKSAKKNLAEMTRDELEEFCILKIVEGIVDRSSLSDIKSKMKTIQKNMEEYRKKAMLLSKQNRDLQVVLKSVQEEQKNRPNNTITPLKITRSVGMQVLMLDKGPKKKPTAQNTNANTTKPITRNMGQPARPQRTASINQNIPVPRLIPASPAKSTPSSPATTIAKPQTPNGIRNSVSPAQKAAEKRPMTRQASTSNNMTVDLTDDEPPAKVNKTSPMPPVRLVPSQNLMAPLRGQMQTNNPRKVFIPINGQGHNLVRGQTAVMLKSLPQSAGPRQRLPSIPRMASNAVRINVNRHPAPLPDVMKQYQPPTWKALPPAPDLKLSKVENGIVISWKIEGYQEDSYEKIASYQLYAYQETSTPPSTALWKKIGDVKALPLPMACTLTQFMAGFKYYFAVRAVDVKSRLGPFSLPGSILLLNKM